MNLTYQLNESQVFSVKRQALREKVQEKRGSILILDAPARPLVPSPAGVRLGRTGALTGYLCSDTDEAILLEPALSSMWGSMRECVAAVPVGSVPASVRRVIGHVRGRCSTASE